MSNVISGLPPLDPGRFQTEVSKPAAGDQPGFLDTVQKALDQAQQVQGEAAQKVSNLLSGRGTEDVQSVMVAAEKADLSFQLVMQVRNKIVQAYKEVSGLQF
jgi:flagellar hook-basal body complex protein FliE